MHNAARDDPRTEIQTQYVRDCVADRTGQQCHCRIDEWTMYSPLYSQLRLKTLLKDPQVDTSEIIVNENVCGDNDKNFGDDNDVIDNVGDNDG